LPTEVNNGFRRRPAFYRGRVQARSTDLRCEEESPHQGDCGARGNCNDLGDGRSLSRHKHDYDRPDDQGGDREQGSRGSRAPPDGLFVPLSVAPSAFAPPTPSAHVEPINAAPDSPAATFAGREIDETSRATMCHVT